MYMPSWVAAAKELGAKVRFGTIDADLNRGLSRRFDISSLPVLLYYHAGYDKTDDLAQLYQGGRSERILTNFGNELYDAYL